MRVLALLALSASIAGCGLLPEMGGGGASSSPGTLDAARRAEIARAVDAKYGELAAADPAGAPEAIAAFLRTIPELDHVAVSPAGDGTVYARFVDGVPYVITNDGPDDGEGGAPPPAPGTLQSLTLPTGRKAIALEALSKDDGWPANTQVLDGLKNAGYDVNHVAFSLGALRSIDLANVGVVFLNTHGGRGGVKVDGEPIPTTFWTTDSVTSDSSSALTDDLENGRLALVSAAKSATAHESHWAITPAFVSKYFNTGAAGYTRAFVFAQACSSAASDDMAKAFLDGGASAYVGWDRDVVATGAANRARVVFSRLLAQPAIYDLGGSPYRPIDVDWILNEEAGRLSVAAKTPGDPASALLLKTRAGDDGRAMLAPAIVAMDISTTDGSNLAVRGVFGPDVPMDRVKVTVGGAPVTVLGVARAPGGACADVCPDVVNVKLPDTGAGSSGDVVVAIDALKSNAAPLTEWRPTFTTIDALDAPCTATLTWKLHLRADVHAFLVRPVAAGQEPTLRQNNAPITPAPDSTLTWSVTGSDANASCSGSGTAPSGRFMPSVRYVYAPDQSPPIAPLFDIYLDSTTGFTATRTDAKGAHDDPFGLGYWAGTAPLHPTPKLDATTFSMKGDSSAGISVTTTWADASATNAPTAKTAR